jgi:hypothetical protein
VTVRRRKYGSGHAYYVDDEHYPGVTTIIGATVPKNGLINWASRTTAEYAVNYWDDLAELPISERLTRLLGAKDADRDSAARRGTQVHRLGARLVRGERVAVPEELEGHVTSYVRWLDEVNPAWVFSELVVANRTHRYCGTADLIADLPPMEWEDQIIPRGRWLLDLKTGRSGIWFETALQLCGYEHAETYRDPAAPDEERPVPWLGIEYCGAIHVTADGCELRPLETGSEVWAYFQHLRWLYDRQKPPWVGEAARPALTLADEPDHPF